MMYRLEHGCRHVFPAPDEWRGRWCCTCGQQGAARLPTDVDLIEIEHSTAGKPVALHAWRYGVRDRVR